MGRLDKGARVAVWLPVPGLLLVFQRLAPLLAAPLVLLPAHLLALLLALVPTLLPVSAWAQSRAYDAAQQQARTQAAQAFQDRMRSANAQADLDRLRAANERERQTQSYRAPVGGGAPYGSSGGESAWRGSSTRPTPAADPEAARRAAQEQAQLDAQRRPERQRIVAWIGERLGRIAAGTGRAEDYTGTLDLDPSVLACRESPYIVQSHRASLEAARQLLSSGFANEAAACRITRDTITMLEQVARMSYRQKSLLGQCGVTTPVHWSIFERLDAADASATAVRQAYNAQWVDCYSKGLTDVKLSSAGRDAAASGAKESK